MEMVDPPLLRTLAAEIQKLAASILEQSGQTVASVLLFTIFMKDDNGVEKKVIYTKGKPQDFEMSESLVVTGKLKDDVFVSDEILMKCPSKYKGEEELINAQNAG